MTLVVFQKSLSFVYLYISIQLACLSSSRENLTPRAQKWSFVSYESWLSTEDWRRSSLDDSGGDSWAIAAKARYLRDNSTGATEHSSIPAHMSHKCARVGCGDSNCCPIDFLVTFTFTHFCIASLILSRILDHLVTNNQDNRLILAHYFSSNNNVKCTI